MKTVLVYIPPIGSVQQLKSILLRWNYYSTYLRTKLNLIIRGLSISSCAFCSPSLSRLALPYSLFPSILLPTPTVLSLSTPPLLHRIFSSYHLTTIPLNQVTTASFHYLTTSPLHHSSLQVTKSPKHNLVTPLTQITGLLLHHLTTTHNSYPALLHTFSSSPTNSFTPPQHPCKTYFTLSLLVQLYLTPYWTGCGQDCSDVEMERLTHAWLLATDDPVSGIGQIVSLFNSTMFENFSSFEPSESSDNTYGWRASKSV